MRGKKSGAVRYRKIETRLIVSRTLLGQIAFLRHLPLGTLAGKEREHSRQNPPLYRDGSPLQGRAFSEYVAGSDDGEKSQVRAAWTPTLPRLPYGSRGGKLLRPRFYSLQINRRQARAKRGASIRSVPPSFSQVTRLLGYGVLSDLKGPQDLPVLEKMGRETPRNVHEGAARDISSATARTATIRKDSR